MIEQPVVIRFVKTVKKFFVIFSCFAIPGIMVCAVYAFLRYIGFWIVTPLILIAYLAFYCWYALHISMGTVIGIEVTNQVVHVKTKRGIYTYDVERGCTAVRKKRNAWVVTFCTQDTKDKFTFYSRVPFAKPYETVFTQEQIDSFSRNAVIEKM